jgi:hypothetical protein
VGLPEMPKLPKSRKLNDKIIDHKEYEGTQDKKATKGEADHAPSQPHQAQNSSQAGNTV